MDRFDHYFKQRVTEGEMDAVSDAVERAIWNLAKDAGFVGVITGAEPVEHDPTNLSIVLSGPAKGYDKDGKRLYFLAEQTVDCSVDENGVPTTVLGVGKGRWLSVFWEFDRVLSDLRVDGASQQVYYNRAEGQRVIVRQGAEADVGTEIRPALSSNMLLICDVKIIKDTAAITDAMINIDRRESFIIASAGTVAIDDSAFDTIVGATVQAAMASADAKVDALETASAASITRMNNHVGGTAEKHDAEDIPTAPGGWTQLAGVNAQAVFTEIDSELKGIEKLLLYQIGATIMNGCAPTDGGGLTVNVAAGYAITSPGRVHLVGDTIDVPDDDVSWVYVDASGGLAWSGLGPLAGATAIAKVTTAGGDITELIDIRVVTDNNRKQLKIRVGSDNSAHFTRLSDAVVALEELRSISTTFDFEIELVGVVSEDIIGQLPIVIASDGWRIRGLTNNRLDCDVNLVSEFIRIEGCNDIIIEDIDIRFSTATAPSNAAQNRFTFYGEHSDRVVLRRIRQAEFDTGVHGFLTFDPNNTCSQWTVEQCYVDDCRDFAIRVPSPNTGGQGVLTKSVIRDNVFIAHSAGARFSPTNGIRIEEGADILVDHCTVEGFGTTGISVGTVTTACRVHVTNCHVKDCAGDGIGVQVAATRCHIVNNDIEGIADPNDGILVAGNHNFVGFNHIAAGAAYGLLVTGEFNITSGNQSRGNGNSIAANNSDTDNRDDA